jgi:hypothetical protein
MTRALEAKGFCPPAFSNPLGVPAMADVNLDAAQAAFSRQKNSLRNWIVAQLSYVNGGATSRPHTIDSPYQGTAHAFPDVFRGRCIGVVRFAC